MLHKTLIRQILAYGSECWPILQKDGNMLRIFERRMLRMIYGPFSDNGTWRTRCTNERYTLYDGLHIVNVIKIGRLRWLVRFFRMQELDPWRKLTLLKPDGTRRVGERKLMCLESVEEELKNMDVRNWKST